MTSPWVWAGLILAYVTVAVGCAVLYALFPIYGEGTRFDHEKREFVPDYTFAVVMGLFWPATLPISGAFIAMAVLLTVSGLIVSKLVNLATRHRWNTRWRRMC